MKESRSRIGYSMRSSDRLCSCCSTSSLNMSTTSIGRAPALLFRAFSCTRERSGRNPSQLICVFNPTNGSPHLGELGGAFRYVKKTMLPFAFHLLHSFSSGPRT